MKWKIENGPGENNVGKGNSGQNYSIIATDSEKRDD